MTTSILENIRQKYNLTPAKIARTLEVADATVVRVLNGNRGMGAALLKRTYKHFPDEVLAWLKEE
ncbi:XRE family transcriptional regulator [Candidatus Pacearchaeota archaeon]|jgi:plasmid maintenance system antidote protein VapI|nr:XRE family transcriptional regulator [Candidatus Pacearchaeota archaeon]